MVQVGDLYTMWGYVKKLKLYMYLFEEILIELIKCVYYFFVFNLLRFLVYIFFFLFVISFSFIQMILECGVCILILITVFLI